jgi:digeranylgeranylglycerophospholipid reductase
LPPNTQYDIIVVGAGPAGSSAAFAAAERGARVALFEEHEQPGTPVVCAEGLSRSTIKGFLDIKPEWIACSLDGAIIRGPSGREFTIEYPGCGWILDRTIFDAALAERARACGADVKTSTKAVGIEDNDIIVYERGVQKRYRFRQLIGADGMTSRIGRWMGIDTRIGTENLEVCAEYLVENIDIRQHYASLIVGMDYAPGGYAWIFPKSATAANIGLGITPHMTRHNARWILDQWMQREFPQGRIIRRTFGGVPAKILPRFSGANFFLVGDAARLTDPLSGAGIATAIKSGMFAGEGAVRRLHGDPDNYEARLSKHILPELRYHRRVRSGYLKMTDQEFEKIFDVSRKIFEDTTVQDINIRRIVTRILVSSPHILRIAFNLLF